MRIGALFSGGKDSAYAAYMESKRNELSCLITIFPRSDMSYMFHFPDLNWTRLQAESMGVPQLTEETLGEKEEELADLARAIRRAKAEYRLEGICTGALASVYQKSRVEKICSSMDLECVSPLWGVEPEQHLRRLVDEGFAVLVVGVSALGLTQEWLGRILDHGAVDELVSLAKKFGFHAGLEGGEGETFVLDAPSFAKRVEVRSGVRHWRADSGYYEITDAVLVPKARPRGPEA
ncbi:MAG TPA: diphthine--ammonia ligase [Nitrososphaerales archaeon]|nr:diphthine--ammonia ligase [Nitrososphaerales archaeon]